MGTNYYRVPSVEEMEDRKETLIKQIQKLSLDPLSVSEKWRDTIKMDDHSEGLNPWERFTDDIEIHLGKRSSGWKFLWNFHDNVYYSNKEELFAFIRSGRVINEYGEELSADEFITMALEWGQPDGYDHKKYRQEHPRQYHYDFERPEEYIDGLRVSPNTDFF